MKVYDISPLLHDGIAVWPGDARFSRRVSLRLSRGDAVELSEMRLSLHTGAHADAPSHFRPGGCSIDRVGLERYWGPALLVTVPGQGAITPPKLEAALSSGPARLLLRAHPDFDPDRFPSVIRWLTPEAAHHIGLAGVRLLGIDAPSVDPLDSKDLPAHKALEANGVMVLENLHLAGTPDGRYELAALPLKIAGGDAAPVRAALRELRGNEHV